MNKKRIIIVVASVVFAFLCTLGCYIAVKNWQSTPDYGSYTGNSSPLFQEAYPRANDKQKRQLTNIQDAYQLPGDYTRQIMIIMGDLPRNTQRLSLSKAEKICESIKEEYNAGNISDNELEYVICQRFNEIAGAPDFEGGSGIGRSIYHLNDTGSERLMVMFGVVIYWGEGEDGKTIFSTAD